MSMSEFAVNEAPTSNSTSGNAPVVIPRRETANVFLAGTTAATAANYGVFWTAAGSDVPRSGTKAIYEVTAVIERHETAGSDGSAVTVQVVKVPSGTAKGSGTAVMTSTFDMKGTANTNQSATVSSTKANRQLAAGDSLALILTGTPTSVAGVAVTVELKRVKFQN